MGYSSPTKRDPHVQIAQDVAARERVTRAPAVPFNLITFPYDIQPIGIWPVFPGEGLKNLMLQSQVWSDPLASGMKNVGWWCEYMFFYVKWRDLRGWDQAVDTGVSATLVDMMLNNNAMDTFQDADGNAATYCYPGAVDYVLECTKRVVDEYFRDEGENWDDYLLDGIPKAKIYWKGRGDPFERLTLDTSYEDRRTLVPGRMSEFDMAMQEWQAMRDMGLLDMDFQDWMKAYNVDVREDENSVNLHRPEDLAHWEEWTYPTNTVEPTTGNPATSVGWRVKARAGKYKFFKEPGWIVGFNTIRPKVYLSNQQGTMSGAFQARADWLPPQLINQHTVSHKLFGNGTGPLKGVMDAGNVDYWCDLRDYLNFGEQFINYATPASGYNGVPFMELPTSAGIRRYPTDTEIMALFSDTTNGRFRQDGNCSLNITSVVSQNNDPSLTMAAR